MGAGGVDNGGEYLVQSEQRNTNQFNIALECSTNLVNWSSATNGAYGGSLTEAKFFRIKVEKIN